IRLAMAFMFPLAITLAQRGGPAQRHGPQRRADEGGSTSGRARAPPRGDAASCRDLPPAIVPSLRRARLSRVRALMILAASRGIVRGIALGFRSHRVRAAAARIRTRFVAIAVILRLAGSRSCLVYDI